MFTSSRFMPVSLSGRNAAADNVADCGCSDEIARQAGCLPSGDQTFWGIPFDCGEAFVYLNGGSVMLDIPPTDTKWLVFLHASETPPDRADEYGIVRQHRGDPPMGECICEYILHYADGQTAAIPVRSRLEINDMRINWGHGALLSQSHVRGTSFVTATDDIVAGRKTRVWGNSQFRVNQPGWGQQLQQWLFAYQNPRPGVAITGLHIVHKRGGLFLFGITSGDVDGHPLRYGRRQKAVLSLTGDPNDPFGLIDIDMGHIISVLPRRVYPNASWERSSADEQPGIAGGQYIVEYNAHDDAVLYLGIDRTPLAVADIPRQHEIYICPAERPVRLKVLDPAGRPVPVKVHAHGTAGEYLPPRHRHRIPNPHWFEDYSADLVRGEHWSTYIDGSAQYLLPLGEVFFEICKGFEIKPVRRRFDITHETDEIVITLERVIDWRAKGWVTADTHVHFLSPSTALLEGEAEGVNVVNLLASQWGELFTNIGDFTGHGELSSSSGEHIVRVGTENRQHIMGHISLLGYDGDMILPLTTGGPDESAQGDPMECTLTQWAAQCRAQNGLSIIPHFPSPRAENAAAIVSELIDGVEVCGRGINPYYLSDWYRYLNCGYQVAAVGGTDKMAATTAVGEMRTYALLDGPLTYQSWKDAVSAGRTFATSGALVELRVENAGMGERLELRNGGRLTVRWSVASAVVPVTSLELVVNGETVDGIKFDGLLGEQSGYFTIDVQHSSWVALRVRGRPAGGSEIIVAHTSSVFVLIGGQPIFSGPDAATILEQIEGVTAYVKTMATRAQETQFKLALAALTGAHRALHNRMHAEGHYHRHSPEDNHKEHK